MYFYLIVGQECLNNAVCVSLMLPCSISTVVILPTRFVRLPQTYWIKSLWVITEVVSAREQNLISACTSESFLYRKTSRRVVSPANRVSVWTVTRSLNGAGLTSKRPVKRPELTTRHKRACLDWAHDRLNMYTR